MMQYHLSTGRKCKYRARDRCHSRHKHITWHRTPFSRGDPSFSKMILELEFGVERLSVRFAPPDVESVDTKAVEFKIHVAQFVRRMMIDRARLFVFLKPTQFSKYCGLTSYIL